MRLDRPPAMRAFNDVHRLRPSSRPFGRRGEALSPPTAALTSFLFRPHPIFIRRGRARRYPDRGSQRGSNGDAAEGMRQADPQGRRQVAGCSGALHGRCRIHLPSKIDPRSFLERIRPDVHVKGGDYSGDLIERETVERYGGRVAIVSYLNGFSSTAFVNKIRSIS